MKILGVDPGVTGAAALFDGDLLSDVRDLPIDDDRQLDAFQFVQWLLEWEPDLLVTERTFRNDRLVRLTGEVLAAAKIAQVPRLIVETRTWKKAMTGTASKDKALSIKTCLALIPTAPLLKPRARKPSDDRAEAVLLALYGKRVWNC